MWENWLIVIPARLKSTRLPEKPLADLGGKPLVVRVLDKARQLADRGADVVVATDSERIADEVRRHGGVAVMTREDHVSGTTRVAEVADKRPRPFVMNVQGDEPFIQSTDLERLARSMEAAPHPEMGSLFYVSRDAPAFAGASVVKVVTDKAGFALYFSRSPIPHHREDIARFEQFNQHLGVYAFRREALAQFAAWPACDIERKESLEQLRALHNGMRIYMVQAEHSSVGIDTPEDLADARRHF